MHTALLAKIFDAARWAFDLLQLNQTVSKLGNRCTRKSTAKLPNSVLKMKLFIPTARDLTFKNSRHSVTSRNTILTFSI